MKRTWACSAINAVPHKKFLLVSFFVLGTATHTKEHKTNTKFRSNNNAALLAAPIQQSAQSLSDSLSGKDTICRLSCSLAGWISGLSVSWVAQSRSRSERVDQATLLSTARDQQQKGLYKIVFVLRLASQQVSS